MEDKFFESLAYVLPAAITGFVAFYMFKNFLLEQSNQRKIELLAKKKKETLPSKLQAYERLLLFCDRIRPDKLIFRTNYSPQNLNDHKSILIKTIEQEFEHNLVQQLYVSDEVWKGVVGLKQIFINDIKEISENSKSIKEFNDKVFLNSNNSESKVEVVNSILKNEVKKLI